MKLKLVSIAIASTFGLCTFAASAEDAYQGAWYVLPNVGVMHTDSDLKADKNNFAYGIRVGKEISENWDVQVGISNSQAHEDSATYSGGRYRQTMLGVDALYMFSREGLKPFLLAGLGYAHNGIHYDGAATNPNADGSQNSWMANVGAGLQYQFTESLGMQADIRQVFSRAKADGGLFGADKHETIGNTYLNFGVIFKFGVPAKVASAEVAEPVVTTSPPEKMAEPEKTPEAVPKAMPAIVAEPELAKVTLQSETLFSFDKSDIKAEGKKTLDTEVVEKMKANPRIELVLITGHADRIGSEQYNQALSERRAEAVQAYLLSQNIEASRMHTVGKGETEPVVECNGKKSKKVINCLQANRRVVIEIETR